MNDELFIMTPSGERIPTITCAGPRTSKVALLNLFRAHFKNTGGLTLSPVRSKEGLEDYVMKEEGRVKGPFFLGNSEKTQQFSMKQTKLKPWLSLQKC